MFQLAFGMPSDLQSSSSWWMKVFRDFFGVLDSIVYRVISWIYQIIFYIADADFFSTDLMTDFFGRVQVIIGIFMIFKLSVSVLQVIINPDLLTDQKKGMGKIITRVIIMLMMLTAIIPLDGIPEASAPDHSYNEYLKKYGILYGTMYSLQYRVMSSNTIGRFVTGDNTYQMYNVNGTQNEDFKTKVKDSANLFSSSILRAFVRPNLNTDAGDNEEYKHEENYVCKSEDKVKNGLSPAAKAIATGIGTAAGYAYAGPIGAAVGAVVGAGLSEIANTVYNLLVNEKVGTFYVIWGLTNTKPSEIIELVNIECDAGFAFAYLPILSTVVGIIVLVMLIGYCTDIAIRTIKLSIIRLLSPIAIISYVDPQSSEKGMFANWTKVLIATYLDLFLRILILYIVVFFGQSIMNGDMDLKLGSSFLEVVAQIIIVIALFYFARIAPKFISDALGLKGMLGNVGLSGVLSVAGVVRAGGNLRDVASAVGNNTRMQADAFNQGKQAPSLTQNFNSGSDLVAHRLTGDDKMTYAQMMRNRRQNTREGITPQIADDIHTKKFKLDDEATKAQNLYDNFIKGNLTASEMNGLNYQFGHLNDQTGQMEMNDAEYQRAREYLEDNALRAKSEAGKWSAYDDEVQKKIASSGQKQSFEEKYRARTNQSNATFSDLRSDNGRQAMFNQGVVQGIRNVVGIPGNEMRANRENRTEQRNQRITDRINRQQRSNEDINQSR